MSKTTLQKLLKEAQKRHPESILIQDKKFSKKNKSEARERRELMRKERRLLEAELADAFPSAFFLVDLAVIAYENASDINDMKTIFASMRRWRDINKRLSVISQDYKHEASYLRDKYRIQYQSGICNRVIAQGDDIATLEKSLNRGI